MSPRLGLPVTRCPIPGSGMEVGDSPTPSSRAPDLSSPKLGSAKELTSTETHPIRFGGKGSDSMECSCTLGCGGFGIAGVGTRTNRGGNHHGCRAQAVAVCAIPFGVAQQPNAPVLPSTSAGLGWPPNTGSPRRLPRRLQCGVRGGGGVSEDELRGRTPEWIDSLTGHSHDVPARDVVFTAWETDPFRYASAIAAYAPEHQKQELLECMRELQRLHVLQDADGRKALQMLHHQYWQNRTAQEGRDRIAAEERGETFVHDETPPPDFAKSSEMDAWRSWATAWARIRTYPIIGDLAAGTLVAFGERDHAGAELEWIARSAWRHLEADRTTLGRFVGGVNIFWNVRVLRLADVLAMQPKVQQPKQAAAAPLQAGKAEFTISALAAWFRLREGTWPKDQPTPNEEADRAAAEAWFRNLDLSRDAFRRLRREKTSEAWKKVGRRKGLSNSP